MDCNGEGIDGIRSVVLRRSEASGMGLGFSIMGGAGYDFPPVIYGIEKDSPAARSGVLEAGDIILAINEREVVKLSTKEVLKCLRLSGEIVHIKYRRDPHVVSRVRKFLSTPASHYLHSGELSSPNHVHSSPMSKGPEAWQNSSQTITVPPPVSPRSKAVGSDRQKDLQNPNHISSFSEDVFINHSHSQQLHNTAKSFHQNNPFSNSVEKNGRKNFETFVMTGEAILNLTRNDTNDSYRSPTKTTSKLTPMSPMTQHLAMESKSAQFSSESEMHEKVHHNLSIEEDSPPLPPPPPSNTSSKSEKVEGKSDILPPPPLLECELGEEDSRSPKYGCTNENGVVICNNGDIKDCVQGSVDFNSMNNNEDTSISSSVMSDSEEALNDDDDDDADDQELLIGNGEKDKNRIVLKVEAKNIGCKDSANGLPLDPPMQIRNSLEKERYPEYLLLGKGSPNVSEDDYDPNSASESISPVRKQSKSKLQKVHSSKDTDNESDEEMDHDQEADESSESGVVGRLPNGSGGESDSSDVESMRVAPVVKAVDLPSAERLAKRLYNLDGFRVTDVWRQLCKCNDFSRAVATEYLKSFDFHDQTLDVSLRKFLSICPLRGETSERERVLEHFSIRYVDCNPNVLGSGDSVHTLTCALMLLNTDIYSDVKAGRPMSCSEFIKNLNGLNDGKDFPKEILKQLYHSIKHKPLVSPNDVEEEEDSNRKVLPVEPPIVSRSQEYKRGFLRRKSIYEAGGKKTPLGKRSWKMYHCRLKELILVFSPDEIVKPSGPVVKCQTVKTHHCFATVAVDYQKRPYVFKLILADRSQFLFQSSDSREMSSWIDILNWNAAKFSAPAGPPPISSSRTFQRPTLPSYLTRLSCREQVTSHQHSIAKYEEEFGEWNQLLHGSKNTTSFQKKEIRERLAFYQYEIQRYKVYLEELEKRITEESENPGGQEELLELQVLPNPPAVLVEEADENMVS